MIRTPFTPLLAALSIATAAAAEVPRVATDIAPVHSLAAQVMDGLGTPDLIIRPGATPHGYALRPSEAAALEAADAVIWIGPALTPWLADAVATLAPDADRLTLLTVAATRTLPYRETPVFAVPPGAADDARHHDAHADHGGGDHDGPAEEDHGHGSHDGHGHGHGHEDHDHDRSGTDPHAWLDPENARRWLDLIADRLSRLDPENAATYHANAEAGRKAIDAAESEARAALSALGSTAYLVFHDAYQYFERPFGLAPAGAIAAGDAVDPGPARVARLRRLIDETDIRCVFAEPQFGSGLIDTVIEGSETRSATLDPMGSDIAPGRDFYPDLIRSLARSMAGCL